MRPKDILKNWHRLLIEGGPGSGYFDHPGRPGEVGGSAPEGGGGGSRSRSGDKSAPDKSGKSGGSNHIGETKNYFDKHEKHDKDLGHSIMLQTWSRRMGNEAQQITTYKSKEKGQEGTYWARVLGGYSGSLNTWAMTKGHKTEEDAVKATIEKAKWALTPLSKERGKPAPYIYPD